MSPISPYAGNAALQLAQLRQELGLGAPQSAGSTGVDTSGVNAFSKAESQVQPGNVQTPGNFENLLGSFVREVNGKQTDATSAVNGLLRGDNVPLHQAMLSMEEANVSFQLMVEVRNKLLEGYQELLRMQV